jgi:hypothetical protein
MFFMASSSAFAQDDYNPLSNAQQPLPLIMAGNIDNCTERYNYCIASCNKQKTQCESRGNDKEYCDAGYTTCTVSCKNHMTACWSE